MYRLTLSVAVSLLAAAAHAQTVVAPPASNFGAKVRAHYTVVGGDYLPGASASQSVADGVASASASGRAGTLRATSRSAPEPPRPTGTYGVTAEASYWDRALVSPLRLDDGDDPLFIDWSLTIDGSMGRGRYGGSRGAALQSYFGVDESSYNAGGNYTTLTSGDTVRLTGRIELGATPITLFYYARISTWAYGSAYSDFGNTVRFEWSIPEGVTWRSASGEFVAPTIQAAAVTTPEPASFGLLAAGVGALRLFARRRRARGAQLAAVAVVALSAVSPAQAQTRTLDFADLTAAGTYGPGDAIPVTYGSAANLAVTNHTVTGFGNTGLATCGVSNPNSALGYSGRNYSSFAQVVVACQDGRVAQWYFAPTAGSEVRLDAVALGSWPAVGGVGPARPFQLRVFDAGWNELFAFSGDVSAALTVAPNVASTGGLYLQVGTDVNVGVGAITSTVSASAVSAVPEPSTYALSATGLLALGAVTRRRRRAAATLAAAAAAAALSACADTAAPDDGLTRDYGAPVAVGSGHVRTYVVRDGDAAGAPVEIGVAFDEAALQGLPAPMTMNMNVGDDPHAHADMHVYDLAMPAGHATPYQFVELDWNPAGHELPGIYDVPHFDVHFYTISPAARNAIDPTALGAAQYAAKSNALPPQAEQPQFYAALSAPGEPLTALPRMGVHWVDVRSPELQAVLGRPENARPFTTTFLHGSWDGQFIFDEPMVTRAFLLGRKTATAAASRDSVIALPAAAQTRSGLAPGAYHVTYDAAAKEYHIALTQFARRP